jgi:hypothetical protein
MVHVREWTLPAPIERRMCQISPSKVAMEACLRPLHSGEASVCGELQLDPIIFF